MEVNQTTRELRWPMGADPVSQASLWVPQQLYRWQAQVLLDLTKPGARVAVVTPNESGKTSMVIPVAGLSWMAAFPGARVVSTSGVERQIRENLWPVLRATLARFPGWTITEELRIRGPSIDGLPGSTWTAFTTNDPNYAEGFHNLVFLDRYRRQRFAPLMIIVDEAKTYETREMFDAFRRCDPLVWLVISTPGEDRGPFFDCFHSMRGRPWKVHEVTWQDCPHLLEGTKYQARQELIAEKGDRDPLVQSMIYGRFFRSGHFMIFDNLDAVRRAMSGLLMQRRGPRAVAVDLSGGGDEQVLAKREGNVVLPLMTWRERDTAALTRTLSREFERFGVRAEDITCDEGGLGKPIIDSLEAMGWKGIYRYLGNAQARDPNSYVNRYAEDHFELRYAIDQGAVVLPRDERLEDQLRRRRYARRNDDSNRVRVEPKPDVRKRGEESPDRLDAVVMVMTRFRVPAATQKEKHGGPRTGYIEDMLRAGQESQEETVFATWAD